MGRKEKRQQLNKEEKKRSSYLHIIENEPKTTDEKELESLIFGKVQSKEHELKTNEKVRRL